MNNSGAGLKWENLPICHGPQPVKSDTLSLCPPSLKNMIYEECKKRFILHFLTSLACPPSLSYIISLAPTTPPATCDINIRSRVWKMNKFSLILRSITRIYSPLYRDPVVYAPLKMGAGTFLFQNSFKRDRGKDGFKFFARNCPRDETELPACLKIASEIIWVLIQLRLASPPSLLLVMSGIFQEPPAKLMDAKKCNLFYWYSTFMAGKSHLHDTEYNMQITIWRNNAKFV